MARGYVIGRAVVRDAEAWGRYAALATEAIKKHGGKPIVRGGRCEVLEGEGRARNVVIEFESFEAARAYYFSADYQAAKALRQQAGFIDLVVVEGA
jgi:uncharacterized protein (DUF1330 family)